MLVIAGYLLVAMAMFAGGVLVAAPFGLVQADAGPGLWLLFPAFLVVGYGLIATGASVGRLRFPSTVLSALLLLLALTAALGLVLDASGVAVLTGSTLPLWYVLFLAGISGAFGAATTQKIREA